MAITHIYIDIFIKIFYMVWWCSIKVLMMCFPENILDHLCITLRCYQILLRFIEVIFETQMIMSYCMLRFSIGGWWYTIKIQELCLFYRAAP